MCRFMICITLHLLSQNTGDSSKIALEIPLQADASRQAWPYWSVVSRFLRRSIPGASHPLISQFLATVGIIDREVDKEKALKVHSWPFKLAWKVRIWPCKGFRS